MANVVLVIAGTLTALLAGVCFALSGASSPALARMKDREYLRAMQNINRVIVNPVFMLSFLGPVVLLPLAAWLNWDKAGWLLIGASIAHIVGGVGFTVRGNIPLNDRLEKIALDDESDDEIKTIRTWYEKPWDQWHLARTIATIAGTVAVFAAAV